MMYTHFHFMHINISQIRMEMKKTAKSTDTQREKERKKNLDSTDGRAYAYTLYDKVKKWVCCEWPIVRPSFSLKKKRKPKTTNKTILCSSSSSKKTIRHKFKNIYYLNDSLKSNEIQHARADKKRNELLKRVGGARYTSLALSTAQCTLRECNSVSVHDWHPQPPFLTVIYHLFAKVVQFSKREREKRCFW